MKGRSEADTMNDKIQNHNVIHGVSYFLPQFSSFLQLCFQIIDLRAVKDIGENRCRHYAKVFYLNTWFHKKKVKNGGEKHDAPSIT